MRSLIFACVLFALAALCAPAVLPPLLALAKPAVMRAAPSLGQSLIRRAAARADTAEIAASVDGHFYLDAVVNRQRVRFLVDTGATAVVLRQSDAESAGLRVGRGDYTHRVTTANGGTTAAEVMLATIAVGDIEVRNTPALVIADDQLAISLLGATFLNRLKRYAVADGTLVLEN